VQDTRYGRAVLAESYEVPEIAQAVTRYVARRMVERERALAADAPRKLGVPERITQAEKRRRFFRAVGNFLFGLVVGVVGLFALALYYAAHH